MWGRKGIQSSRETRTPKSGTALAPPPTPNTQVQVGTEPSPTLHSRNSFQFLARGTQAPGTTRHTKRGCRCVSLDWGLGSSLRATW